MSKKRLSAKELRRTNRERGITGPVHPVVVGLSKPELLAKLTQSEERVRLLQMNRHVMLVQLERAQVAARAWKAAAKIYRWYMTAVDIDHERKLRRPPTNRCDNVMHYS